MTLLVFFATSVSGAPAQAKSTFLNDPSFGNEGLSTGVIGPIEASATLSPKALAIDAQGRVIVGAASSNRWKVWRVLPNGTLDTTFGDEGEVTVSDWGGTNNPALVNLASGAIRPDGRILLVGYQGSTVVGDRRKDTPFLITKQVLPDGSPDPVFGYTGGRSSGPQRGALSVALRQDGGFLIGAFKQMSQTGQTDDGALSSLMCLRAEAVE